MSDIWSPPVVSPNGCATSGPIHSVTLGQVRATSRPRFRWTQRAPIIAAYRPLAGKVVEGYFRDLPDDADHPVFALTPAG